MVIVKIILFPIACLYGFIIEIRNKLFDWKILPSKSFLLPVISVGNLSAGGTGKTPHTEYLAGLIKNIYNTAILSRGYGRKTKGFLIASSESRQTDIGDEPAQYVKKFSDVVIAVDNDRRRGISRILHEKSDTRVILLDDAFQHRYVKPGLSILLTDYHHLYVNDYLLPTGMLRERARGARRADIIIVTKTPKVLSPIIRRNIQEELKLRPHQKLCYSYIGYEQPVPIKWGANEKPAASKFSYIIMVAGVANSYPLQEYLSGLCNELIVMNFRDHHQYTVQDLEKISREYDAIISKDKVIFTTEKDATRLDQEEFIPYLGKLPIYYIPIRIKFHDCDNISFDKLILDYVQKSIGSGRFHQGPH